MNGLIRVCNLSWRKSTCRTFPWTRVGTGGFRAFSTIVPTMFQSDCRLGNLMFLPTRCESCSPPREREFLRLRNESQMVRPPPHATRRFQILNMFGFESKRPVGCFQRVVHDNILKSLDSACYLLSFKAMPKKHAKHTLGWSPNQLVPISASIR